MPRETVSLELLSFAVTEMSQVCWLTHSSAQHSAETYEIRKLYSYIPASVSCNCQKQGISIQIFYDIFQDFKMSICLQTELSSAMIQPSIYQKILIDITLEFEGATDLTKELNTWETVKNWTYFVPFSNRKFLFRKHCDWYSVLRYIGGISHARFGETRSRWHAVLRRLSLSAFPQGSDELCESEVPRQINCLSLGHLVRLRQ
jgi:hypothetical protein